MGLYIAPASYAFSYGHDVVSKTAGLFKVSMFAVCVFESLSEYYKRLPHQILKLDKELRSFLNFASVVLVYQSLKDIFTRDKDGKWIYQRGPTAATIMFLTAFRVTLLVKFLAHLGVCIIDSTGLGKLTKIGMTFLGFTCISDLYDTIFGNKTWADKWTDFKNARKLTTDVQGDSKSESERKSLLSEFQALVKEGEGNAEKDQTEESNTQRDIAVARGAVRKSTKERKEAEEASQAALEAMNRLSQVQGVLERIEKDGVEEARYKGAVEAAREKLTKASEDRNKLFVNRVTDKLKELQGSLKLNNKEAQATHEYTRVRVLSTGSADRSEPGSSFNHAELLNYCKNQVAYLKAKEADAKFAIVRAGFATLTNITTIAFVAFWFLAPGSTFVMGILTHIANTSDIFGFLTSECIDDYKPQNALAATLADRPQLAPLDPARA